LGVFFWWISGEFFTFEEHEAPVELSLFSISICNLENVPLVVQWQGIDD
jgi:hypothetical protein